MKRNPLLTWAAGDQHTLRFHVADLSLDIRGRTPAILSGYDGSWALSRRGTKGYFKTPVLTLDATIPDQTASPGVVDVLVESEDTADFLGPHHYQLEISDGSGGTEVVAEGDIEFVLNIEDA